MATQQPTSSSASQAAPYTHQITGNLCIGYLAAHLSNSSVILSDQNGRAIARVMGMTLDQAAGFADQIIAAFNRQQQFARLRSLMSRLRRGTTFAVVGVAVYALIVAACLF